jgi:hypothetical protein
MTRTNKRFRIKTQIKNKYISLFFFFFFFFFLPRPANVLPKEEDERFTSPVLDPLRLMVPRRLTCSETLRSTRQRERKSNKFHHKKKDEDEEKKQTALNSGDQGRR